MRDSGYPQPRQKNRGKASKMSSVANALRVTPPAGGEGNPAELPSGMGALLAALSTVLHDTLERFEDISGRVTENVRTRGNAADHDLIIALQDFDRLQQEFAALGEVISHCAATSDAAWSKGDLHALGYEAINAITLADLKDRLLNCLKINAMMSAPSPGDAEQVF